jgi:hypothetical protein
MRMVWLFRAKMWVVWSVKFQGQSFKQCQRTKTTASNTRFPSVTTSWKRTELFCRKTVIKVLGISESNQGRHCVGEWRVQAGAGRRGQGSIYSVEIPAGAKNIKGLFKCPSAFSSARHLCSWPYQLYFNSEYTQMTGPAHIPDCYLFVILALLPPTWVVPFWCR